MRVSCSAPSHHKVHLPQLLIQAGQCITHLFMPSLPQKKNKKNNHGGFGAACEEFGTVTRGSSPISLIFISVTKHGNWWSSNQFRDKHHRVASLQSTPLNHQSWGETREKQDIGCFSTCSGPGIGIPVAFRKMSDYFPWKNPIALGIPSHQSFLRKTFRCFVVALIFKIHFLDKVA